MNSAAKELDGRVIKTVVIVDPEREIVEIYTCINNKFLPGKSRLKKSMSDHVEFL